MKKIIMTMLVFVFLANCDVKDVVKNKDMGNDINNRGSDIGKDVVLKDVADLEPLGPPTITRTAPEKCDNSRPDQTFDPTRSTGCDSDDECTDGDNGRCVYQARIDVGDRVCTYDACFQDDDCEQDTACSCGKDLHSDSVFFLRADENKCVNANCRTNDDCGSQFCKPNLGSCRDTGDRVHGYFCTTENDECRNNSDCGVGFCVFSNDADKWACMNDCP